MLAAERTVSIAFVSLVFIVGGYVLLAGLFYVIVYRPSRAERRRRATREGETLRGPSDRQDAAGESP